MLKQNNKDKKMEARFKRASNYKDKLKGLFLTSNITA